MAMSLPPSYLTEHTAWRAWARAAIRRAKPRARDRLVRMLNELAEQTGTRPVGWAAAALELFDMRIEAEERARRSAAIRGVVEALKAAIDAQAGVQLRGPHRLAFSFAFATASATRRATS
jgi:hypothetical protein